MKVLAPLERGPGPFDEGNGICNSGWRSRRHVACDFRCELTIDLIRVLSRQSAQLDTRGIDHDAMQVWQLMAEYESHPVNMMQEKGRLRALSYLTPTTVFSWKPCA
jgi:hypothetical protein